MPDPDGQSPAKKPPPGVATTEQVSDRIPRDRNQLTHSTKALLYDSPTNARYYLGVFSPPSLFVSFIFVYFFILFCRATAATSWRPGYWRSRATHSRLAAETARRNVVDCRGRVGPSRGP